MEKYLNEDGQVCEAPASPTVDASFPDPKAQFELWLDTLKPSQQADNTSAPVSGVEEQAPDFFVECDAGTNCRIEFTGVLSVGGYFSGNLRTEEGVLVTRARGRINADIDVIGEAFIDSPVNGNINATGRVVLTSNARVVGNINATGRVVLNSNARIAGNINATGRVVLNSNARVVGNINAPALSVKRGAIFEGDCLFKDDLGDRIESGNVPAREAVKFLSAAVD
jgi:cytoskeletal protein CcmA (bactofilin family)